MKSFSVRLAIAKEDGAGEDAPSQDALEQDANENAGKTYNFTFVKLESWSSHLLN